MKPKYVCQVCGRDSPNLSVIEKCKHTRKKKTVVGQEEVQIIDSQALVVSEQQPPVKAVFQETLLDNREGSVRRIYHCSDIHIRLNSRHDEYREIFADFYSKLEQSEPGLIVCCGDILHNKNELSPECVVLCLEFLENLANIMPTVFIAGNHDAVLTNNDRLDSLSAILNKRSIPNLYYLKQSGVYRFRNVVFGVSSLLDDTMVYASTINRGSGDYLIGLFHGSVGSPLNDLGFKISGEKTLSEFEGYDMVLLGDIHKFQYLNPEKTIAYSSSLISQNFGECDKWHGYLEWHLEDKSSIYHIVKNDYAFRKIVMGDSLADIQPKANLEVQISKTSEDLDENYREKVMQFKAKIGRELPMAKVRYVYLDEHQKSSDMTIYDMKMEYSSKLVLYLKSSWLPKAPSAEISPDDIEWVMNHVDLNIKSHNCSKYELLLMEWDYMGRYGKGNRFDFRNLKSHGVSGILANNSMGKSTFIDILTFMLFSKTNRNISNRKHIPTDILNIYQKSCRGKLYFRTSMNSLYMIEKKCVRGTKDDSIKLTTWFYLLEEGYGDYEWEGKKYRLTELHGKERGETDRIISEIIGTYDDFLFQSVFLQFDNVNFRTMAPSQRKNFMFRLFQLDHITKQYPTVRDEAKKIRAQLDYVRSELEKVDKVALSQEHSRLLNEKQQLASVLEANKIKTAKLNARHHELLRKIVPLDSAWEQLRDYSTEIAEIDNKLAYGFKYVGKDICKHIIEGYNIGSANHNQKVQELNRQIAELKVSLKTVIDLDFCQERFAELASITFDEGLDSRITKLEENIRVGTSMGNPQTPKMSREFLLGKIENNRCSIFEMEDKMAKAIQTRDAIELDETTEQRYNEYKQGLANKKNLTELRIKIVAYIGDIETNHQYNPECHICMRNPQVEMLLKYRADLVETEAKLAQIILDSQIEDEYQTYSILKSTRDKQMKDIERLMSNIQNAKLSIVQYEKDLEGVANYEKWLGLVDDKKQLVELIKIRDTRNEFLRLKNLYPIYLQQQSILEENSKIISHISELELDIKRLGEYVNPEYEQYLVESSEIDLITAKRADLMEKQERFKVYQINNAIEWEIAQIKFELEQLGKDSMKDILEIEKEIGSIESKLAMWDTNNENLAILMREANRYGILEAVLGLNGFSLYLLRDRLDQMSHCISNIMTKYIGVALKLTVEKDDLVVYTFRENGQGQNRLDTFGGKETLIYDISFRIYCVQNLGLPFSDTMIFDETFMSFDVNSKGLVPEILGLFADYYKHIIMITHDNYFKDYIHTPIHITSKDVYSQLVF